MHERISTVIVKCLVVVVFFVNTYCGFHLQALWNLSERIGLAKARGLSKEGTHSQTVL